MHTMTTNMYFIFDLTFYLFKLILLSKLFLSFLKPFEFFTFHFSCFRLHFQEKQMISVGCLNFLGFFTLVFLFFAMFKYKFPSNTCLNPYDCSYFSFVPIVSYPWLLTILFTNFLWIFKTRKKLMWSI